MNLLLTRCGRWFMVRLLFDNINVVQLYVNIFFPDLVKENTRSS